MFRTSQIISATELLKHFKLIERHLHEQPEPILVTRRNGEHLVILSADFFEDLLTRLGDPDSARPGIREYMQHKT